MIQKAPADSATRTPIHPAKRPSEDRCIVSGSSIEDEGIPDGAWSPGGASLSGIQEREPDVSCADLTVHASTNLPTLAHGFHLAQRTRLGTRRGTSAEAPFWLAARSQPRRGSRGAASVALNPTCRRRLGLCALPWRVAAHKTCAAPARNCLIYRTFWEWRDPDSNRGHHDFQGVVSGELTWRRNRCIRHYFARADGSAMPSVSLGWRGFGTPSAPRSPNGAIGRSVRSAVTVITGSGSTPTVRSGRSSSRTGLEALNDVIRICPHRARFGEAVSVNAAGAGSRTRRPHAV